MRVSAIAFSVLACGACRAQTPGFWMVGFPSGYTHSAVFGLSQDGAVAVGVMGDRADHNPGFSWTRAGGRDDFGLQPGMPQHTPALAVSSNGGTIVGWASNDMGFPFYLSAYRRVGNGPLQDLGVLAGHVRSQGQGVSGDGSIVVGTSEYVPPPPITFALGEAFRWTESTGLQGLGYLRPNGTRSQAHAISRDGSTIVGTSQSNGFSAPREAYRWTAPLGMQELENLPGVSNIWTEAFTVNSDGSILAGMALDTSINFRAVRWTPAGIELLGGLPRMKSSVAYAISDDGSIVGGSSSSSNEYAAFIWTSERGMVSLADFLLDHGIWAPPDYRLESVRAISGDGLTFGGIARHLVTGHEEGFVATVPSPATVVVLFVLPLWRGRTRRA